MIFYFTGTGNSLYAAKNVAQHFGEELISISAAVNSSNQPYEYNLKENEIVGFVYPVYAWGPPGIVLKFIENLKLNNYREHYIFSIATCGANIGNTMKVLDEHLGEKGIRLNSGFSLIMPNNYIIMGDIDKNEVQKEKLLKTDAVLKDINKVIDQKAKGVFMLEKGFLPGLLTGFVNPMFNKNAIDTAKFYASDDCTHCGICEKVCNCNNIKVNGKPSWGKNCTQCLACIHYCPVKAVQYGKGTGKKGRYTNPYVSVDELYCGKNQMGNQQ